MIVWAQWYGGSSYACPLHSEPTHWERFKSMKQAMRVFYSRSDFDPHFPCVGNDAEMQLYFFGPSEDVEPWKMRPVPRSYPYDRPPRGRSHHQSMNQNPKDRALRGPRPVRLGSRSYLSNER